MGKNTKYSQLCAEITEKVKKSGTSSFSRGDLVSMAHTLVNTPEHEVDVFVQNKEGAADKVVVNPVQHYRESLKPVLKQFGIDKTELDRIHDVQFSKDHAEAIVDLSLNLTKDYIRTGRKLKYPITAMNESAMAVSEVNVGTKVAETKRIEKDEKTGKYEAVPTGKVVTTAEHKAIKVSNKVPHWLKQSK